MVRFRSDSILRIFLFINFLFHLGACSKPFPGSDELILLGLANRIEYLFVTTATFTGSLGGVGGADLKCANSKFGDAPGLPGLDLEYVALLAGPGRNPGGIGWPLRAHTSYFTDTPTTTLVFHTDASALPILPLTSGAGIPGGGDYWTGMGTTMGTVGTNCNAWTDLTASFDADYGSPATTSISAFNNSFGNTCDLPLRLLCVRN